MRRVMLVAALIGLAVVCARAQPPRAAPRRQLLLVLDGLRPDYVTPDLMPNLYALSRQGVVFTQHHSVFPTVTRVNGSSMATGTYPERHGLLGNAVFFPEVDATRFLDTGDRENLLKIDAAVHGELQTVPSLGEILQQHGKKLLAVGSGTTGAAWVLNYKISGGAVLHTEYAAPAELFPQLLGRLGPVPPVAYPNEVRNRRAVDSFLDVGLPQIDPTVTIMWISDPDTTAHRLGIGVPAMLESLKKDDVEVKRIQDGLAARGLLESYDIWITSDHGFATHTGAVDIQTLLKPFAGTLPDGSPRIVTGEGAIYVRDHDRKSIAEIVAALQKSDRVGAIFTQADRPDSIRGWVDGTMSFETIRWGHARAADILYSPDWSDRKNETGWAGTSASNGVAGHGSSSPWEIHNTLIAVGPDLKQRTTIAAPSGNVDFAPTFLALLGFPVPAFMEGRVLREALRSGSGSAVVKTESSEEATATGDGRFMQTAHFTSVQANGASYRYLDWVKAIRK